MKKNKFLLSVLIMVAIVLVQPAVYGRLIPLFTQTDILTQLGVPTEYQPAKNNVADTVVSDQLVQKKFDGVNQVITVEKEGPNFSEDELSLKNGSWENYSDLDLLNRVGVADAMLGKDLMPTEERTSIAHVKPTGWKNKKIIFNGQEDYLYNRSHLIGFQLTGENDNVRNLFTGTRALNANFENEQSSMVYYENMVADYIRTTGSHVRYRVTPIFKDFELVARGIRMQAESIEDNSISFDVYIFNIQPGYTINYQTGSSEKNF